MKNSGRLFLHYLVVKSCKPNTFLIGIYNTLMAQNGLLWADVPLRNYSPTQKYVTKHNMVDTMSSAI